MERIMKMQTTEYQMDIQETGEGYNVEVYKRHGDSLHKHKNVEDFNSLAEVFHFIRHYPLGPSCYVEGVFLERVNTTTTNLTAQEQSFCNDLLKWNKVRKVEVLVKH